MEEVRAPMAGNIWKLECKAGEVIALDDVVLIMEAMKMEAEVYAPSGGTVAQISVQEGQAVEEGDLLLTIQS
ncbi:MAG: HlyD family efflux transporter periplasmic adaptor subunit [Deferrisomatales bacterium]|nr:HlyD family efflux transporter periplasmic adaptor subunit [Deferrisomatales bacterium]